MKLSAILPTILALASMTVAAPAVAPAPEALEKRDTNTAWCEWNSDTNTNFWISTTGPWAQDNAQGLRDNIQTQCGYDRVQDWTFYYDGNRGGHVAFHLTAGWPQKCVENAIYTASMATGAIANVECRFLEQ